MKLIEFPSIPQDLLIALEEKFPNKLPDSTSITIEEVRRLQGEQDVVRFLRAIFERQQRTILESP